MSHDRFEENQKYKKSDHLDEIESFFEFLYVLMSWNQTLQLTSSQSHINLFDLEFMSYAQESKYRI